MLAIFLLFTIETVHHAQRVRIDYEAVDFEKFENFWVFYNELRKIFENSVEFIIKEISDLKTLYVLLLANIDCFTFI